MSFTLIETLKIIVVLALFVSVFFLPIIVANIIIYTKYLRSESLRNQSTFFAYYHLGKPFKWSTTFIILGLQFLWMTLIMYIFLG